MRTSIPGCHKVRMKSKAMRDWCRWTALCVLLGCAPGAEPADAARDGLDGSTVDANIDTSPEASRDGGLPGDGSVDDASVDPCWESGYGSDIPCGCRSVCEGEFIAVRSACPSFLACLEAQACDVARCVDQLDAACGDANLALQTCQDACETRCDAPRCGDGVVAGSEECDGDAILGDTACSARGYERGTLRCTADCRVDESECTGCGVECAGCCDADGRCIAPTQTRCGWRGGACTRCEATEDCRFVSAASAFVCQPVLEDGTPCDQADDCRGGTCTAGRCATDCAPAPGGTGPSCSTSMPCCDPATVCGTAPVPGASRQCCYPPGARVTYCGNCCNPATCTSDFWGNTTC